MKCIICGEKMECHDDVNDVSVRIDWLRCSKCNSYAEINYHASKGHITKVIWWKD